MAKAAKKTKPENVSAEAIAPGEARTRALAILPRTWFKDTEDVRNFLTDRRGAELFNALGCLALEAESEESALALKRYGWQLIDDLHTLAELAALPDDLDQPLHFDNTIEIPDKLECVAALGVAVARQDTRDCGSEDVPLVLFEMVQEFAAELAEDEERSRTAKAAA